MNETIVACAGCGKRYKGVPGAKKFKCKACSNLITFPFAPCDPALGKIWCSSCWTEHDAVEGLTSCHVCSQKISLQHGGQAIVWAAGSSLNASVSEDEIHRGRPDLELKVGELQHQLTSIQASFAEVARQRDEALEKLNNKQCEIAQAQTQLEQYRGAAVAALEPLGLEFTGKMRGIMAELDQIRNHTHELREEVNLRLSSLDRAESELRNHLSLCCREIGTRLSVVMGNDSEPEEPMQHVEVIPAGKSSRLLRTGHLATLLTPPKQA
jgi:hypothetical protein